MLGLKPCASSFQSVGDEVWKTGRPDAQGLCLEVSCGAVLAFQHKRLTDGLPILPRALLKAGEGSEDAPGLPERRLGAQVESEHTSVGLNSKVGEVHMTGTGGIVVPGSARS